MIISYTIAFLVFLLIGLIYYRFAQKFGIVDVPNYRSSHGIPTVRGGGILFPLAVIFWWMSYDFLHTWMVLGLIWIATVSFLDDMYSISRKLRFGVQFLGLTMAFYDLGVFEQVNWITLPFLYFVSLGVINAINFMDGINGITGLYALVFFGTMLAVQVYMPIFEESLIRYVILSILVFLIFNLRKKAMMFAGDIGSISIAYLMIYFLVQWYLVGHSWTVILLLMIYGLDVFLTMARRFKDRENITQPHRTHLYQLLVNLAKFDHVTIAIVYALLQTGVNFTLFVFPQSIPNSALSIGVLLGAAMIYLLVKYRVQHLNRPDLGK
jgi:UDP-N-acetylmuramyl pentapeptide phosphotransferase/UDP-N-acetylglucosamine-1-phosphate transferase